jgi:hypothetical protein
MDPEADIRRVAREYGLDAEEQLERVRPFLGDYLELVFADDHFEIVTGGRGCAMQLARASRLGPARDAFLFTDRRFPGAMLGLKLAVGADTPPTLYHRSLLPLTHAFEHLETLTQGAHALGSTLTGNATLYGLGFTEVSCALRIKTYVLDHTAPELGFRSVRLGPLGPEHDVRSYTPEIGSDSIAAIHARRALGVTRFGHVAHSPARTTKVYVERVGAIPTDYTAI